MTDPCTLGEVARALALIYGLAAAFIFALVKLCP